MVLLVFKMTDQSDMKIRRYPARERWDGIVLGVESLPWTLPNRPHPHIARLTGANKLLQSKSICSMIRLGKFAKFS